MLRKSQEDLLEEIRMIALSGYFPFERNSIGIDAGNLKVCLTKPFGLSNLIAQIKTTLKNIRIETARTAGCLS